MTTEIGIVLWRMRERLRELKWGIVVVGVGVDDVGEMVGKLSGGTVGMRRNAWNPCCWTKCC